LLEKYESGPCCYDILWGQIGFFELGHEMRTHLDGGAILSVISKSYIAPFSPRTVSPLTFRGRGHALRERMGQTSEKFCYSVSPGDGVLPQQCNLNGLSKVFSTAVQTLQNFQYQLTFCTFMRSNGRHWPLFSAFCAL
jgi:hypothetical protein